MRGRVLDAWAASPSRFREDANAEEDYALGGYRDRVVVELAQNAADAAVRAGVPGRLRLTLRDGMLTAANTGAPLDAAGVEALSTLRASSKRDASDGAGAGGSAGGTVGRFGVGFAAVVAVSDAPRIRSAADPVQANTVQANTVQANTVQANTVQANTVQANTVQANTVQANTVQANTVQWSRDLTRDLVRGIPALAGELAARSGHVPVLRLPFAVPGSRRRPPAARRLPDGGRAATAGPGRRFACRQAAHRDRAGAAARAPRPRARGDHRRGRDPAAHRGARRRAFRDHRGWRAERLAGRGRGRRARPRAARRPARRGTGQDILVGPLGGPG